MEELTREIREEIKANIREIIDSYVKGDIEKKEITPKIFHLYKEYPVPEQRALAYYSEAYFGTVSRSML